MLEDKDDSFNQLAKIHPCKTPAKSFLRLQTAIDRMMEDFYNGLELQ